MSDSSPVDDARGPRHHFIRWGMVLGVLGISAAILGTILYRQWDVLISYPWEFRPLPLLAAFGCYTLALFLVVWVWADMMGKLGYPLQFWKHFRYYCMTNLTKRLPGTVWYIAGRAQLYKEDGIPRRVTSAMSGVEMGVMVVAGIVVAWMFGLPILLRYQINLWVIGGVFLGCLFMLHPRVFAFAMQRLGADVSRFGYRDLLTWTGVYLLVWISGGGILFFICQVLITVDILSFGYMVGSWTLVGLLGVIFFFSPSNLGVSEVGFSLLLASLMPPPVAVIVALVVRILPFCYELVWALASWILERGGLSRN